VTSSTRRRNKLHLVQSVASSLQRVVFYCRVSTDEQADQNTIQLQLDYLRGRFRPDFDGQGPVSMQFVTEVVDEGWSGALALADRPGGARVLELAQDGQFDVLALYKVDRLGRKASVLLEAHDLLEAQGVAITSATEPFDTRPGPMQAFGIFVFQLLASIAELERSTIASRTMGGKLRVAKEDKFVNGQVPFGYKVTRGWKVVPASSCWTNSNVSGFVLPERMPVADDGQQLPMFPSDDPGRDLLLRLLMESVETARSLAAINQWLTQNAFERSRRNGHEPESESRAKNKLHRPQNKLFREWHTFRAHFQDLEKKLRRDQHLRPEDQVTREMVYAADGILPKSLQRHMEWHGLRLDQWPPSTWPELAPPRPADA
jgi:DNA invertase Pin-like site-specific DNA recombinase